MHYVSRLYHIRTWTGTRVREQFMLLSHHALTWTMRCYSSRAATMATLWANSRSDKMSPHELSLARVSPRASRPSAGSFTGCLSRSGLSISYFSWCTRTCTMQATLLTFSSRTTQDAPWDLKAASSWLNHSPGPRGEIERLAKAAPALWNDLPLTIKTGPSLPSFRNCLKTYLFLAAYPEQ